MEILSLIVLFLLALTGYSMGVVLSASGKRASPQPLDLLCVVLMWVAAAFTRESLGKWLAILVWVAIGLLVGWLVGGLQRGRYGVDKSSPNLDTPNRWRRGWWRWVHFSGKFGDYQSRVLLAFLYFTVVLPFGLGLRLFGDPLNTRKAPASSVWQEWEESAANLDEARRQF